MESLSIEHIWKTIENSLDKNIALIDSMAQSLFQKKGKALRCELLLAIYEKSSLQVQPSAEDILSAAAIVEMIHTGTLLHDDVIDQSDTRRGGKSHHKIFGNTCTILMGDYFFTRAFSLAFELSSPSPFLKQLSLVTEQLVKGELLQMQFQEQQLCDEKIYNKIITYKTGSLFGLSLAIFNKDSFISIGTDLGCLFQKIDDLLDYFSTPALLGKPIGSDFKERKVTFPLLFAYQYDKSIEKTFFDQNVSFEEMREKLLLYKTLMIDTLEQESALLIEQSQNVFNREQTLFINSLLKKFFAKVKYTEEVAHQNCD